MGLFRPTLLLIVTVACAGCTYDTHPYSRGADIQPAAVDDANIDHRLLLVGDAGAPDPRGEPSLETLAAQVRRLPGRSTIVFLGDNVYERGMPELSTVAQDTQVTDAAHELVPGVFDSREEAVREIEAQIATVRGTSARAIFIPGNHDWDQFEDTGWIRIRALGAYLEGASADGTNVSLRPEGGCPGPVSIPLGSKAMLIVLDTQWWLETRSANKPTPEKNPTNCAYTTESAVQDALRQQLESAAAESRVAIVAGHHPMESDGPHGGFTDFRTHVFPLRMAAAYVPPFAKWIPLPVLGSIAVALRAHNSPSVQDTSNDVNRRMRSSLLQPMVEAQRAGHGPLVYAAGHDHSLQLFESTQGPRFTLVSGLGSSAKTSAVGRNRRTLFAHANPSHPGFMMIDFYRNGAARLAVIERTPEFPDGESVYTIALTGPGGQRASAPQLRIVSVRR